MSFTLLSCLLLLSPVQADNSHTEELYRIEHPERELNGWAETMVALPDLTGDGIIDLALAGRVHGGNANTRVFSGADGTSLFEIIQDPHVLFFGRGIAGVSDHTGDRIPEIVVVGFQSGAADSPNGRIHVYSGADGAVVREHEAPTGVNLLEHPILALDDIDGDGVEDILMLSYGPTGVELQMISCVTGGLLYTSSTNDDQSIALSGPVKTSDHDSDGYLDFMVGVRVSGSAHRLIQVRSGKTGEALNTLFAPAFEVMTGNGEPLVPLADRDSDGLGDFALGGVFFGYVGAYSSADATLLREWSCVDVLCIGSLMINAGDLNGDDHEDLITVARESDPFTGGEEFAIVGLDIETGDAIFYESTTGIQPSYGQSDVLLSMPGIDAAGAPAFAVFNFEADHVSVRRFVFDDGEDTAPTGVVGNEVLGQAGIRAGR